MEELDQLRRQIDIIDDKIIALLHQRFDLVKKVKDIKTKRAIPILDTNRETLILRRIEQKLYNREISMVYKTIFSVSKDLQKAK